MANPIASASDVRDEIDTSLSDLEITPYIDDAAFENEMYNDISNQSDELRKRIEQKLAAIKILERRERQSGSTSVASTSISYSESADGILALKREVDGYDDSGELVDIPTRSNSGDYEVF